LIPQPHTPLIPLSLIKGLASNVILRNPDEIGMTKNLWVGLGQCADSPHHPQALRYAQGDMEIQLFWGKALIKGKGPGGWITRQYQTQFLALSTLKRDNDYIVIVSGWP
jgi:hypothetical protein